MNFKISKVAISLLLTIACNTWANNLNIGDLYQGGIIFWLDESGEHGLIAARTDHNTDEQWSESAVEVGASGDGVYSGNLNTINIISKLQETDARFAALIAGDYITGPDGTACDLSDSTNDCYGDWYLPSKFELNLMYDQQGTIGGFGPYAYWSSTEIDFDSAWGQYFGNGDQGNFDKRDTFKIRMVRAF